MATRRGILLRLAGGLIALLLAGCGGSGGGSASKGTAPTLTTRARVQTLHDLSVRGIMHAGFQPPTMAYGRNGAVGLDNHGYLPGTGGGTPLPPTPAVSIPMIGAFLKNIAAVPPPARASRRARTLRVSRDEPTPPQPPSPGPIAPPLDPPGGPPIADPSFYYDYFLGLWVQVTETPGKTVYALFEDEEKTKPAGNIETLQPTDYTSYPQEYRSTYTFTAGFLAGSHGTSDNITNADYSGSATYENVYADGWRDSGQSAWTGHGDYTWHARTDTADGKWTEGSGSFRVDGSGGTRMTTSEGYSAVYVFNADGSGHGRITGSDPGLPVTIVWDAYGNTTIEYADGTIERIPGWGGYYGGGDSGEGTVVPVTEPASVPPAPSMGNAGL